MLTRAAIVLVMAGGGVLAQDEGGSPGPDDEAIVEESLPEVIAPAELTPGSPPPATEPPDDAPVSGEPDEAASDGITSSDPERGDTDPSDTEPAETAAPVGEPQDTPASLPSDLPRCDSLLPPHPAGQVDCFIDNAGPILIFTYTFTPSQGNKVSQLSLSQSAPEGGERRTSEPIRVTDVVLPPMITDMDDDGDHELWLPVGRVGLETIFELWLLDEDYFFQRRSEITAMTPDAIIPRDDLLILASPNADHPLRRIETAMFLDPTGLTELYSVEIDDDAKTCRLLRTNTGTTLNAEIIEADCADRLGFPSPVAPAPSAGPEIYPKDI